MTFAAFAKGLKFNHFLGEGVGLAHFLSRFRASAPSHGLVDDRPVKFFLVRIPAKWL